MSFSKPIPPSNVTLKTSPDGSQNPKYVDLLDEDKPMAGQKFVCLSFISPEHILKQKDMFLFEEFIKKWDFSKSMEKFTQFLNFISSNIILNLIILPKISKNLLKMSVTICLLPPLKMISRISWTNMKNV